MDQPPPTAGRPTNTTHTATRIKAPMSSQPQQSADHGQQDIGGDVWQRLRNQLEQTQTGGQGAEDEKIRAQRLADRAKLFRQRLERPLTDRAQQTFLVFNKQQERYGVPLHEVVAVETLEHLTPAPNTAGFIRGVIPWRGSILSLVDLGRLFGRTETGIADVRACVIVEKAGQRLALVAYEVEAIIGVEDSELVQAPDLPAEIAPEWILGVHDENRLILRVSELMKGIANIQQAETS